jgi:uncharacterized protein
MLVLAFALIAFVYASVGFGGGSSYLAILALAAIPYPEMRLTALICNVVVVLGNAVLYVQKKQVDWPKVLPLVLASVPLAFLGARVRIQEATFFLLLGIALVAAAVLLWVQPEKQTFDGSEPDSAKSVRDACIGGSIGLLSGLVGIGGGIFLSPILHFLRWDTPRKIAATASFFILVNSLSGILGQLLSNTVPLNWPFIGSLVLAVLLGGQLGLRFSFRFFSPVLIRRATAVLVLAAGVEVLWKHLFQNM